MNIIEYVNRRNTEIKDFANEWLIQNKIDPKNWPLFMSRAEWDEQENMTIYEDTSCQD